jgi:hypothetical protein
MNNRADAELVVIHEVAPNDSESKGYFHFSQNNSGGSFHINDSVAHHVIIEARDANDANRRALDVGIYFDGCAEGIDCSCCGDRWYEQWHSEKGDPEPLIYGSPPAEHKDFFTKVGQPMCHVYHLDGSKTTYTVTAPNRLTNEKGGA